MLVRYYLYNITDSLKHIFFDFRVIAIIAGVFGCIFLILLSIGIACFVCYKKGKLVCVKVRPGKYTMRRVKKNEHQTQNQQNEMTVHQQDNRQLKSQNSHQWQNYPPQPTQGEHYHSGMSGYI